ncbi:hypothetical protein GTQ99_13620 [Kineococcus sp. T13]|uniref:hypothetical protein n=1 Tax=Kineococcus vitellinus TaxID=2696565 RepID=UPI00141218C1|nr:hypothetical protein [Kineococcus vitellinus]NAZ76444.1 hypothetical protein [Kineococcus vitellinus]
MSASPEKPPAGRLLLLPAFIPLAVALCLTTLPDTWWRTVLLLLVTLGGAVVAGVALRTQGAAARAAQRDQEALDGLEPLPRDRPDAR